MAFILSNIEWNFQTEKIDNMQLITQPIVIISEENSYNFNDLFNRLKVKYKMKIDICLFRNEVKKPFLVEG